MGLCKIFEGEEKVSTNNSERFIMNEVLQIKVAFLLLTSLEELFEACPFALTSQRDLTLSIRRCL